MTNSAEVAKVIAARATASACPTRASIGEHDVTERRYMAGLYDGQETGGYPSWLVAQPAVSRRGHIRLS